MRKKILIIFCVLLGAISAVAYLYPEKEEAVPTRILLENIGGKVIFDHKLHADLVSCEDCHHERLNLTEDVLACGYCHGVVVENGTPILNRMQAFHQLCRGCHEDMGVGPYDDTQCAQCHTSKAGF